MNVSVFGSGYVGLVTACCLAELGNALVCVDIDPKKVERLSRGECPIYEPGLEPLLASNLAAGRLRFTTDAALAIEHGDVIFIAVGTPPNADGSVDMQYVQSVATTLGQALERKAAGRHTVIVNKSTVPVGTVDQVKAWVLAAMSTPDATRFSVVSNPEFLKEGAAVQDFMQAERVIVGVDCDAALQAMKTLYAPIASTPETFMVMDIRSAELTKYAANAMLATKISFMNEMSRIAEAVGADIEQVRWGMGADSRIGYHFISPGCGYGGSCFPKDVLAAKWVAETHGASADILTAVHEVNERQKARLLEKIDQHYPTGVKGKVFALWGLAFKPNTDDIRSASARVVLEGLIARGATVQAYDPKANDAIAEAYPALLGDGLTLCQSAQDTLAQADALVIVTEWSEFRNTDLQNLATTLRDRVVFDGRNLYAPAALRAAGLHYYSIGRQSV